jgi:FkbM family methyltransferase
MSGIVRLGLERVCVMLIFDLFDLDDKIEIMDVGASAIAEVPIYKVLLEKRMALLTAFDGDARQITAIENAYGKDFVTVLNYFLFDGGKHDVYLCAPASGMSSLFKPKVEALSFFNGFSKFGEVQSIENIQTTRLDDIENVKSPDFLKMDVQGAELEIIKNGTNKLEDCLAIQLEVSYFNLYEKQPSFGEVDVYLRELGFIPHMFLDVKRWAIAPTIFNGNFRVPGNQLLESDVVYVKNPLSLAELNVIQLKKLAILAHYSFKSFDFCVRLLIELERREVCDVNSHKQYLLNIKNFD